MFVVQRILYFLVGGIILLHTMVPHEHFNPDQEITIVHSHQCTTDLFGEIQISFGVDHGQGHFEHFFKVPQDAPSIQLLEVLISYNPTEAIDFAYQVEEEVPFTSFIPPDPLRGPPSILA